MEKSSRSLALIPTKFHALNAIPSLPPPTMRDMVACFTDHAVRVAESSCSSASSFAPSLNTPPQPENSVSCSYTATLSSRKQLLITLTWHRLSFGGGSSVLVLVEDNSSAKRDAHCQLLRKKKGSRGPFPSANSACDLRWDFSAAKYGAGPEPAKDFYLVLVADGELALSVGDTAGDLIRSKLDRKPRVAEWSLYRRAEQVFGVMHHSTRARFRGGGREHEVMVRCKGDDGDARDAELYVCVDRKRLINVRSIKWNFRGNQTIYIDGSAVDVLWDVHDWWFRGSPPGGGGAAATFMFRTRSNIVESNLWSEEELAKATSQFTLLIQAFKNR